MFLIQLFLALNLAQAACPDLSGTFQCPKYGSQPESKLVVSQATQNDITTYTYTFDFDLAHPSSSDYTERGHMDKDLLKFCHDKNIYIGQTTGTNPGSVQAHFLNTNGDYVVTIKNKEVMHCVKIATPTKKEHL